MTPEAAKSIENAIASIMKCVVAQIETQITNAQKSGALSSPEPFVEQASYFFGECLPSQPGVGPYILLTRGGGHAQLKMTPNRQSIARLAQQMGSDTDRPPELVASDLASNVVYDLSATVYGVQVPRLAEKLGDPTEIVWQVPARFSQLSMAELTAP